MTICHNNKLIYHKNKVLPTIVDKNVQEKNISENTVLYEHNMEAVIVRSRLLRLFTSIIVLENYPFYRLTASLGK